MQDFHCWKVYVHLFGETILFHAYYIRAALFFFIYAYSHNSIINLILAVDYLTRRLALITLDMEVVQQIARHLHLLGWLLAYHGTDGIVRLNIPRLGLGYEAAGDNHLVRHLVIRYALGLHHLLRGLGYLTVIQQVFKGFPHRPLPTPLLCPRLASF